MADFASEYGIRMATAGLSGSELMTYAAGLLSSPGSRLFRFFTPPDGEPDTF